MIIIRFLVFLFVSFILFSFAFLHAYDNFSDSMVLRGSEKTGVILNDLLLSENSQESLLDSLRARAVGGDLRSQYTLGRAYVEGKGVERDDSEALKFFKMAADQGHPESQLMVGNLLMYGRGVDHDVSKAEVYYEASAREGLVKGQYAYGLILLNKKPSQVEEAEKWFFKASEKGDISSSYELALIWYKDATTRKQGIDLLMELADRGHTQSEHAVGMIHERGREVEADKDKAIFWYERAALKGHEMSQLNLAKIYLDEGGSEDIDRAVDLLEQSAKQGVEEAQFMLGIVYGDESNPGVLNETKSFTWFLRAARLGHAYAQYNVGLIFADGRGVNVNQVKSLYWFRKASDQGVDAATYQIALAHDDERREVYDRSKALDM